MIHPIPADGAIFTPQHSLVSERVNGFERRSDNSDFPRERFMAAGVVAELEVTDFVVVLANVDDQIPLADLLMIDVEKNLDLGTADRVDNLGGMIAPDDVIAGMIGQHVEGFKNKGRSSRLFDDVGRLFEHLDDPTRHLFLAESGDFDPTGHRRDGSTDQGSDFGRFVYLLQEVRLPLGVDHAAGASSRIHWYSKSLG